MRKNQVIERFCKLSRAVSQQRFKSQEAADCICEPSHSLMAIGGYQFSEQVMHFIETAVHDELARVQGRTR